MDERRVADYFVVAGLPEELEPVDDFSKDGTYLKPTYNQAPITDITVIIPSAEETVPPGYTAIESTPQGYLADLNYGSLQSPEIFLCYKRGRDKPPLVDIGVMYDGKERILPDSEIVLKTPKGLSANINNSSRQKTYLTYRRAPPTMPCNALVVTDIVVIMTNKGEDPPHAFCMINKNLNRGLVGADIFLCYKKSVNRANVISYKPGILSRYPHYDRSNFPFPTSVPLFCLPMGATLECWPVTAKQPEPVFSTFVLTVSDAAQKVYGSAITFYEQCPRDKVTPEQKRELDLGESGGGDSVTYHTNKCICLLSHWPFFDTFEKFLLFLYNMACEGPHTVPIERYISHFLEEVPFPSIQRPRILVQLSPEYRLILTQPEDLPLPRSGAGFRQLLINLGPENCLQVLLYALTEQKVLIHSLRPDVLTAVAEAVSMIIFPFKWQCPYIPLCPLGLAEVLHAPLPFLIGVDSRFFDLYDPPTDVNCVDLDTNYITVCENIKYYVTSKLLPKKPARTLRNSLERLYQKLHLLLQSMQSSAQNNDKADESSIDQDFQLRRKEQSLELEIQEAFLRFMASILKGYRGFLLPIIKAPTVGTTDTNSLFDLQGFLRSRDRAHHKFFSLIMRTQMFIRFIEERSFVSDMDAGLAFFDECTEKVDGENGDVHLIELDESHHSERTVFIMPPEPTGLPSGELYTYEGFTLNPLLFSHKELKNLLTVAGRPGSRLSGSGIAPGSPMARRTKHEIKSAQKLARKYASSPELWAKCLLGTCFSIWFIHLPSFALMSHNKAPATLRIAYELLVRIQKAGFVLKDEVCYRVMMQLCGVYSQPVLAVKILFQMKRSGLQPNAITYGFYNRAVLEAAWPSDMNNSSQLLWNKLRNVILGAALFRQAGSRLAKHRRLSTVTDDGIPAAGDVSVDGISHTSADSSNSHDSNMPKSNAVTAQSGMNNAANSMDFAAFDRFRSRVGSIVRPTGLPLLSPSAALKQHSFESSAGLLMPGIGATLKEEDSDLFDSDHIDSLVGSSPPAVPPPKRRGRSGSCSEFIFTSTQVAPRPQLKHAPTSPKPGNHDADCFKLLTRSESFANDAGILAKLSLLKLEMQPSSSDSTGSLTGSGQMNGRNKNQSGLKSLGQTCSKALFRRRGSLNLKRLKENTASESCESSTENLGGSSTGGSCEGGSIDDLEAGINNSGLKRNRILSALGSKVNKIGGEVWTSRRNSVDSVTKMKTSKSSNESLCKSPIKSPSRTPVTENDPLGALMNDVEHTEKQTQKEYETVSRLSSEIELDHSGAPVLFDRRKGEWGVVRSATFHQRGDEDSDEEEEDEDESSEVRSGGSSRKSMQRSSTMPIDGTDNTAGQGTLGSLGSTFKLPFTRYSPARFSLRKADLRIGTQLIENAITNFSPSSLTSKKSNEILMGGLHSLKSAATSVAKKFDEIKEAISANSTPIKTGSMHSVDQDDCLLQADTVENSTVDATYPRRKVSSEFSPLAVSHHIDMWSSNLLDLFGDGSRKGSASNLQPLGEQHSWASQPYLLAEKLYPKMSRDPRIAIALEITMTTCSKCHNCASVLYDEEIMAGWVPDDSNLNTKCIFCDKATVPFLCVSVLDYRSCSVLVVKSSVESLDRKSSLLGASNSSVNSNSGGGTEEEPVACEPITVPYLNPLVLRKELESILYAEGDSCLTEPKFVDEHPIIYWNMVWVFQRISVTSHLPGLCLRAVSVLNQRQESSLHPSWAKADHNNVVIRCMWDNPRLHEEVGQPMYVLWNQDEQQSSLLSALLTDRTTVSRGVMESVINSVRCNDLVEPLKKLATERHKLKGRGVNRSHSLYRDILYLAFGVLGRENIDQSAFDREYITAYYTIPERDSKMYLRCDRPPSQASLFCRSCFKELEL